MLSTEHVGENSGLFPDREPLGAAFLRISRKMGVERADGIADLQLSFVYGGKL
jgi:hypothetical protein